MPRAALPLVVILLAAGCEQSEERPQAEIIPPAGPPTDNPAAYQSGAAVEPPPMPGDTLVADSVVRDPTPLPQPDSGAR